MYRLALDLGTNSLGWCVFSLSDDLRPESISRMGVRIFSDGRDPKSGASLAVERRMARQARRRRDRLLGRKNALMGALVEFGLMPRAQEERKRLERLDPYRIRAEGLEKKLSLYELGRALFHINQRRGFKSNRKTDKSNEDGKIVSGIQRLRERLAAANARTLGEYLYTCTVAKGEMRSSRNCSLFPVDTSTTVAEGEMRSSRNEHPGRADASKV